MDSATPVQGLTPRCLAERLNVQIWLPGTLSQSARQQPYKCYNTDQVAAHAPNTSTEDMYSCRSKSAYSNGCALIIHLMLSKRCFGVVPNFCYLQCPFDLGLLTWRFST